MALVNTGKEMSTARRGNNVSVLISSFAACRKDYIDFSLVLGRMFSLCASNCV